MLRPQCAWFAFAILAVSAPFWGQTAAPADLDSYVANAMKTFEVPGIAVAIVKDGKVVLAKGYGVRKLGDPTPVDEYTMFGIGSNTKAFTTAALAGLVDAGKLSWDDPVYQRMPGFVRNIRVIHHETGQALVDGIVPGELSCVDQAGQRGGGEGLRI